MDFVLTLYWIFKRVNSKETSKNVPGTNKSCIKIGENLKKNLKKNWKKNWKKLKKKLKKNLKKKLKKIWKKFEKNGRKVMAESHGGKSWRKVTAESCIGKSHRSSWKYVAESHGGYLHPKLSPMSRGRTVVPSWRSFVRSKSVGRRGGGGGWKIPNL